MIEKKEKLTTIKNYTVVNSLWFAIFFLFACYPNISLSKEQYLKIVFNFELRKRTVSVARIILQQHALGLHKFVYIFYQH